MLEFCKAQDEIARKLMRLYICDPNRNAECNKRGGLCGNKCICTSKKKHAKRVNGKAVNIADDERGKAQIIEYLDAVRRDHLSQMEEVKKQLHKLLKGEKKQ